MANRRPSISVYDSEFQVQEDEVLQLPDASEVHQFIKDGANAVTFLHVALYILSSVELQLVDRSDELRFVKDCLNAGQEHTQLPCKLVASRGSFKDSSIHPGSAFKREGSLSNNSSRATSRQRQSQKSDPQSPARVISGGDIRAPALWRCHQLRGMLRAQRSPDNIHSDPISDENSVPWMGPPVPRWPVQRLDEGTATSLENMFHSNFSEWDFDIFKLSKITHGRPLQFTSWEALRRCGCFSEFPLNPEKLCNFLAEVESQYMTESFTAYHNTIHAADVTQTVHSTLHEFGAAVYCDPMDMMGILIAATIHDMGHDGKNNAFHINNLDHIALTWNDRRVLENYHVSEAFKLLVQHSDTNFLEGLTKEQLRILRQEIISMILSTDMANHFTDVGNFNKVVEQCGHEPALWHEDAQSMDVFRCMVLHASDISNPAKSFHLASQWSERCLREFFIQGDDEHRLGLPVSPMCDRANTNVPGSQIGFIDFIVQPTFTALADLLPSARTVALKGIDNNRELWRRRQDELEMGTTGTLDTRTLRDTFSPLGQVTPSASYRSL